MAITISPSAFASAFERLQYAIAKASGNNRAFSFQDANTLPHQWEHYKDWVYLEARRILQDKALKKASIGTGTILGKVIEAVEIHKDNKYRNNIVTWDARYGEKGKSHQKMLAAHRDPTLWKRADQLLFQMYRDGGSPSKCFEELCELFGARYDLVSYLFFIRDWERYMPVKPRIFSKAFNELGVPHEMSNRCAWKNYEGFLDRLREVQRHLTAYNLPGGLRLIDAHSFCWMLASEKLISNTRKEKVSVIRTTPGIMDFPLWQNSPSSKELTQDQLEERLEMQKIIGALAVARVLQTEKKHLKEAGRADLAAQVIDVSPNVSLGYDIASFTMMGWQNQSR